MDKKILKDKLTANHNAFAASVSSLNNEEFLSCKGGKWTAGQQLEHIYLSVVPLRQILSLPKFLLKLIWGKANRESKSYEELVKKYLLKLESGGKATKRFVPKAVNLEDRQSLKTKLQNEVKNLCSVLDRFTEKELDEYVLPHPLLGKLTLREMMYFTIYHVEHHSKLMKQNLQS